MPLTMLPALELITAFLPMKGHMNIMTAPMSFNLFLTLRIFSDTGGIQKVCRTMCSALSDLITTDKELLVLSLCDRSDDLDKRYLETHRFKGFRYNKLWFALVAIWKTFSATTILLSHINLIPIVFFIKLIKPQTKVILLVHGTEVWRALPFWKSNFLRAACTDLVGQRFYRTTTCTKTWPCFENQVKVLHNCLDPFFDLSGKLYQS